MSKTASLLVLTLTLLFGMAALAQGAAPVPPTSHPDTAASTPSPAQSGDAGAPSAQSQAHQTLEKLGPDLNLTADQKTKLEPIVAGEIQVVHDLRADTSMTPEQKQAKFRETMTADHAKIDAILTPEQKQKLQQLNEQRQAEQQGQAPGSSSGSSSTQGATPGQNSTPNQATPQMPKK